MNLKRFYKGLVGVVGVVLASLAMTNADNVYVQAIIAVATYFGIYHTPYVPKGR